MSSGESLFPCAVLLILYNRADATARVFERVRSLRPRTLYLAADGPRGDIEGDQEACRRAREAVQDVDWECEVNRRYQEGNLGCKRGVSSAITWFFEHVREGIILEDDCIPDPSFFEFCAGMLDRYRNDNRIGYIAGTNYLGDTPYPYSYFFSRHCPIWGWATWQRAWKKYDLNMAAWPEARDEDEVSAAHRHPGFAAMLRSVYDLVFDGRIDTWDHQWSFTCLRENWLTVIPRCNLVTNIGFSKSATHTKDPVNKLSGRPSFSIDCRSLTHPTVMLPVPRLEEMLSSFVVSAVAGGEQKSPKDTASGRVKQWLRKLR